MNGCEEPASVVVLAPHGENSACCMMLSSQASMSSLLSDVGALMGEAMAGGKVRVRLVEEAGKVASKLSCAFQNPNWAGE